LASGPLVFLRLSQQKSYPLAVVFANQGGRKPLAFLSKVQPDNGPLWLAARDLEANVGFAVRGKPMNLARQLKFLSLASVVVQELTGHYFL
jgi:hypothetical protein